MSKIKNELIARQQRQLDRIEQSIVQCTSPEMKEQLKSLLRMEKSNLTKLENMERNEDFEKFLLEI